MERACTYGMMALNIMESGSKIRSMVEESMNGQMADAMMENGRIITCMATESTLGRMVDDIKVNISTIESMDTVFIHGKMVDSMWATGQTESNMVKEHTDNQMEWRRRASGKTVKESGGSMRRYETINNVNFKHYNIIV